MTFVSIALRVLLTLAFVAAGIAKLAGAQMMVHTFDVLGFGQWFRYVTGLVEVSGAVMLWIPGLQAFAGAWLGATMLGALVAHVLVLGVAQGIPAVVLGLICTAVIYLHRDQINKYLGRSA